MGAKHTVGVMNYLSGEGGQRHNHHPLEKLLDCCQLAREGHRAKVPLCHNYATALKRVAFLALVTPSILDVCDTM